MESQMNSTVNPKASNVFQELRMNWNNNKRKSKSIFVRKWKNKAEDDGVSLSEDSVSS